MEVGGWENIEEMGMSVGVIWDDLDGTFQVYLEHQINDIINHCMKADQIVGFNHIGFDFRVLSGAHNKDSEKRLKLLRDEEFIKVF